MPSLCLQMMRHWHRWLCDPVRGDMSLSLNDQLGTLVHPVHLKTSGKHAILLLQLCTNFTFSQLECTFIERWIASLDFMRPRILRLAHHHDNSGLSASEIQGKDTSTYWCPTKCCLYFSIIPREKCQPIIIVGLYILPTKIYWCLQYTKVCIFLCPCLFLW